MALRDISSCSYTENVRRTPLFFGFEKYQIVDLMLSQERSFFFRKDEVRVEDVVGLEQALFLGSVHFELHGHPPLPA